MESLLKKFGFNLTDAQLDLFDNYYELLNFYNTKFNITAITDKKEVYIKHFIDSLLGAKFIEGDFIDIGSGGGFPALPVKIFKPELKATLIEATGKKCEFLKEVVNKLGLLNVNVICGRAEDLAKNSAYREKFSFCTARAVALLPSLTEYCAPFLKVGGKFVAYKADAENEIIQAEHAIKILGCAVEKVEKFDLEGNLRTIAVIKKYRKTPPEYPRTNAKIRKNPL